MAFVFLLQVLPKSYLPGDIKHTYNTRWPDIGLDLQSKPNTLDWFVFSLHGLNNINEMSL